MIVAGVQKLCHRSHTSYINTKFGGLGYCSLQNGFSALNQQRSSLAVPIRPSRMSSTKASAEANERTTAGQLAPPFRKEQQMPPGEERKMETQPDFGYSSYKGTGKMKGKVALLTGADSGIGRAVALAFAREGADIAISYWNEHEDAKETARICEEAGARTLLLPGDLAEELQCKEVVAQTVQKFSRVDVLFNNASYQGPEVGDFREISRDRLERTMRTNIMAMFTIAQEVVDFMPAGGSIINVSSVQAYKGKEGILDYSVTKGAIVTLTKGLAGASTIVDRGIRVNAIAPGPFLTPLVVASFPPEKVEALGKTSPMGRPGQPKECGPLAVFLATDDSSYVTGSTIGITGGQPIN